MPTIEITKPCTKCGEIKPLAKFTTDKRNKSGRGAQCYKCARQYQLATGSSITVTEQMCVKCKQLLLIDAFSKCKSTRNGHKSTCRQCASKASVGYRFSEKRQHTIAAMVARPKEIPAEKPCTVCKETKPSNDFYKTKYTANGLAAACKTCAVKHSQKPEVKQAIRERVSAHRGLHPEKHRQREKVYRDNRKQTYEGQRAIKHSRIKNLYGITIDQYEAMVESQNGQCAICSCVPPKGLVIDHCHATKKIRGLLCSPCNLQLGFWESDPQKIKRFTDYLNVTA